MNDMVRFDSGQMAGIVGGASSDDWYSVGVMAGKAARAAWGWVSDTNHPWVYHGDDSK